MAWGTIRSLILNALVAAALLSAPAKADAPPAIARIGVLSPAVSTLEEGLRQALRELGYIEGKNIVIEWRRSTGADEDLRRLATELVRAKVDLIVASGSTAARTLAVELVPVDVHSAAEIDRALRAIRPGTADGVLVSGEFLFLENKATIVRGIRRMRLPAMFPLKQYHDDGALMSYGTNLNEVMRHAAVYVDKILKGAKPSELPVEQVSKYELIIDLRVARAMGIQVPQDLLLRADEVIRLSAAVSRIPLRAVVQKIVPGGLQRGVDRASIDAGQIHRNEIACPDPRRGLGTELQSIAHLPPGPT